MPIEPSRRTSKCPAALGELAAAAGRDPHSIEITVYGEASDPDMLKRFEDAGADRVIVRLQTTEGDAGG